MVHPWERRALEREAQAAADSVDRLERALVASAEELECRAEQLAGVRAAVDANRARMQAANDAGVRIVFDGSRREAEPLWERVPMSAVAMMEQAIKDSDRLAEEESRLLGQVTGLGRRRDQIVRTLERSRLIAAGLRDGLAALDAPESATTDSPADSRAPVGTLETEAEPAEAAAVQGSVPEPITAQPPASVSVRDRLAAIGQRVAGW